MPAPQELPLRLAPVGLAQLEVEFFTTMRKRLVNFLHDTIRNIHQGSPIVNIEAAITTAQDDFKHDLLRIDEPENRENAGRCFRMRAELIVQTLDELIEIFGNEPTQKQLMHTGYVLDMVATQVGRLSLNGYHGEEDVFAEQMDQYSVNLDVRWHANDQSPHEAELQSIWARLRVVHPACVCRQCRKRNERTVPR